ncbi:MULTISPECIES: YgeY family selenium metabolism-linked hydrolase [Clostridium]|uniref:Acetylornithine deacetylase n=2 Tax=Clostridium TaxID=1485 RepID=A0A151ARY1_9CLOT|nr:MULTISPECIES: YgeY family selenium metabolism-linked hydrolase [Clostridium]KYH30352.1 acetylornithine deacetylase [Clostridium colicanis DSM 13634]PRR69465.1 Acetylornithine deacetylase [Clostridium thermopalmarium DSM 5974]PVZ26269.1 putative selenium metabolism hydrolase [Clostridium thermopalmarium DSM 5974]
MDIKNKIIELSEKYKEDMINFLIEMIRIPSFSGEEKKLALTIKNEMMKLEFDEVTIDNLGNVIGRIGNGSKTIAIDAHMDTVQVGDGELWRINPFEGIMVDNVIYGRGAADQKGGIASMVYAGRIIKEMGLYNEYTIYFIGTVMKEEGEGVAWQYIIKEDNIIPDLVIITEPTNLNIYRGSRGKVELMVTVKGLPCDASAPQRGMNAIYEALPIIDELRKLNKKYKNNGFLGQASIAVTQLFFKTPSSGSIPDECVVHIDRRIGIGEDMSSVLEEVRKLNGAQNAKVELIMLDKPSYTGLVYPCRACTPAWSLNEDHEFLKAAKNVYRDIFNKEPKLGKWTISTNGNVTAGIFNIPTIGFGPGNEIFAHGPREQIEVGQLVEACKFYAMLPARLN